MQEYNLIIDEGNSFAKIAVIDKKESCVVREWVESLFNNALLEEIIAENGEPKAAIVSSVRGNAAEYAAMLQRAGIERVVEFGKELLLPMDLCYERQQIGSDRIAAAVGAVARFGRECEMLIIDIGSAITIDRIVNGTFVGGNISLGVDMRFKALCNFTNALPDLTSDGVKNLTDVPFPTLGKTTADAMKLGVFQGVFYEVKGYIDHYFEKNNDLRIIFIGGGAEYFVNRIKNAIFAGRNLMFLGLNEILEYNATR